MSQKISQPDLKCFTPHLQEIDKSKAADEATETMVPAMEMMALTKRVVEGEKQELAAHLIFKS